MAIFRINKNQNYTVMSNHHLRDKTVSLRAKGMLSLMLSLPNDWDYSVEGLVNICGESKEVVQSVLKELEKSFYLVRTKIRNQQGKFEYIYDIHEKPYTEKPYTEKPYMEKPYMEKPYMEKPYMEKPYMEKPRMDEPCTVNSPQINTKELNTKELNTKELNTNKQNTENKERIDGGTETIETILFEIENEQLRQALGSFVEMRKNNSPLTTDAFKLLLNQLFSLSNDCNTLIEIVNTSTVKGWKSFYPLKNKQQHNRLAF